MFSDEVTEIKILGYVVARFSVNLAFEKLVLIFSGRIRWSKIVGTDTTNEAEAQITELQQRAGKIREPIARNTEASSRWATLTQEQLDSMPARQSRELYKSDPDFRAAFDRLAEADAALCACETVISPANAV